MDDLIKLMHRFVEAEEQFNRAKNTFQKALESHIDPLDEDYQLISEEYQMTLRRLVETETPMRSHADFDECELSEVRIMNLPPSTWDPTWNDRD